jgi:predicted lipase
MSSFANEGVNNHDFIKQIFLEQINGRMKRGFL